MGFRFSYIENEFKSLLTQGYVFKNVMEAFEIVEAGRTLPDKCVINRVDVDFNMRRARRLGEIFVALGIPASFYIRLHANEYNPNSFENFSALSWLLRNGFEIGYHSEIIDAASILGDTPEVCLRRDLAILGAMLGKPVTGIASHGGMTGLNNLDFWKNRQPCEFGCRYEAYDSRLFKAGLYVSDSEWTRWKSYERGVRRANCTLSPSEHGRTNAPLIYLLIHSDTYFDNHIYEV